jgi:hypothetical protein
MWRTRRRYGATEGGQRVSDGIEDVAANEKQTAAIDEGSQSLQQLTGC